MPQKPRYRTSAKACQRRRSNAVGYRKKSLAFRVEQIVFAVLGIAIVALSVTLLDVDPMVVFVSAYGGGLIVLGVKGLDSW